MSFKNDRITRYCDKLNQKTNGYVVLSNYYKDNYNCNKLYHKIDNSMFLENENTIENIEPNFKYIKNKKRTDEKSDIKIWDCGYSIIEI